METIYCIYIRVYLGGGFKLRFIFTPKIGEDEPILTHMFQMGTVQPPTRYFVAYYNLLTTPSSPTTTFPIPDPGLPSRWFIGSILHV